MSSRVRFLTPNKARKRLFLPPRGFGGAVCRMSSLHYHLPLCLTPSRSLSCSPRESFIRVSAAFFLKKVLREVEKSSSFSRRRRWGVNHPTSTYTCIPVRLRALVHLESCTKINSSTPIATPLDYCTSPQCERTNPAAQLNLARFPNVARAHASTRSCGHPQHSRSLSSCVVVMWYSELMLRGARVGFSYSKGAHHFTLDTLDIWGALTDGSEPPPPATLGPTGVA